ncbi:hypothetical protein AAFF_G00417690 [Aldrovandia affinis]|uniref:LEM domain-containing protein n=1 Tax=Aldrovandia affinis TaxID=143900 RepID=A0AAD7WJ25_9TELE|nr:hypothetical protein AAFF_G00417690 [Aldrovandia affinis]
MFRVKMAAVQLTDRDLFSELKRHGFTPGPVTENTRPVYLKKLKKLQEELQRGTRSGKNRNSGSINTNSGSSNTAAGGAGLGDRPASNDVTHPRTGRSPGSPCEKRTDGGSKVVLGFSSDESDVEVTQNKEGPRHSGRRFRGSSHILQLLQQQQPRPTETTTANVTKSHSVSSDISTSSFGVLVGRRSVSGSPWWSDRGNSRVGSSHAKETEEEEEGGDYDEDHTDGDSVALNGSRGSYTLNSSKLGGDYSDSEDEEVVSTKERQHDRRLNSRRSQPKSPYKSGRGAESGREKTRGGVIKANDKACARSLDIMEDRGGQEGERKTDQGESVLPGGLRNCGFTGRSGPVSAVMRESGEQGSNCSPTAFNNNHVSRGDCGGSSSRFSSGTNPKFYTYNSLSATYRSNHSNHAAGNHAYLATTQPRKLAVPEEELLQQFKRDEVSATGGFSAHYLSMFLLTAACLFFMLLGLMYLRMRGAGSEVEVVTKNHPFGIEFDDAHVGKDKDIILKVLLQLHEHLAEIAGDHDCGVHNHHPNRSLSLAEASDYLMLHGTDLEQNVASALEWIMRTGEDVGIRLIGNDSEDPVTDISEVMRLESTHPKMSFICRFCRAFLTVIHRVVLSIAAAVVVCGVLYYMMYRWRKEKEETRQMYDMVERIIDVLRSHSEACQESGDLQPYLPIPHVRDSLVQPQDRTKIKKGLGQPFRSKKWQGEAFRPDRRNSPPNSLTPCLKIRNMFDPVMEVGENWHLAIHKAILEKCSDNDGIVHIAVDKNSREGCVYMKCLSAEHSGKAFKALHGSWFDGKLVTVKYLRLDRYHQRFPQALGCSTPLKPSGKHVHTTTLLRHRSSAGNAQGFS